MKIYFYIKNKNERLPNSIAEFNKWIKNYKGYIGPYVWVLQTYLFLKDYVDCELVRIIPKKGIIISHKDFIPFYFIPNKKQFIINIVADRVYNIFSQINLVQNKLDLSTKSIFKYYIPHWPQNDLIKRNKYRKDFKNLCYFGEKQNLNNEIFTQDFIKELKNTGFNFYCINDKNKWNDYSEVDVIIALRQDLKSKYLNKPATKLFNAWLAGTPAILGPESAYIGEKTNDYDYIEVKSKSEIIMALKKLKIDKDYRESFLKNYSIKSSHFNVNKIREKWISFFKFAEKEYKDYLKKSYLDYLIYLFTRNYLYLIKQFIFFIKMIFIKITNKILGKKRK